MPAIPTDTAAMSLTIHWPNGCTSSCAPGRDWLLAARDAGCSIPTGCLGGSCGACEIEVNGQLVRACIATVPPSRSGELRVELANDPHW
jgi:ferredoxin